MNHKLHRLALHKIRIGLLVWLPVELYAVGLLGYFLIRLSIGYHPWPMALFSNFLHLALLPVALLLPTTILARRWRVAGILGLNALAFLWLFGDLLLSNPSIAGCDTPSSCITLTVMTYNLGSDMAEATPERVVEVVRSSGADVIAFQEVSASHLNAFQTELGAEYPFQTVVSAGQGTLGIGILSRYPIGDYEPFHGSIEWLPYLAAEINIKGHALTFLTVHPAPPAISTDPLRAYSSRAINDMWQLSGLTAGNQPMILAGDFNATDQSDEYNILARSGWVDSFRSAGYGFGLTYPANQWYGYTGTPSMPLIRIDYVWHTQHFTATRAWVGSDAGSDHLPVLAQLVWDIGNQY